MSSFIVALEAGSPPSAELASWLGITAYEVNQRVVGGLPAVLLQTPDRARAIELVTRLRGAGHQATACDASAVVPTSAMVVLRDFRFEPEALTLQGIDGRTLDTLPWDDLLVSMRAHQLVGEKSTRTEKETTLSATRIVVTGGMLATKTKTKETVTNTVTREPILVMFRKSGATPWILRETSARYGALEGERAATTPQNFLRAVERIRTHGAPFDDRLLTRKNDDLDLLLHLVALTHTREPSP